MDVLLAIPQIILAIAIVGALGTSLVNLMIAVGISQLPRYARVVRASALTVRGQEFVEAARAVGARDVRIIVENILPNCMAPIIVQSTLGVAQAILSAAALSFLGLGIQPPTPEWGSMLSAGRQFLRQAPYLSFFPGLAISIVVLALNIFGDGLRDSLDPKLRQ
jgi:peptide/nickel transport system permease protein